MLYVISQDPKSTTGNFFVDEYLLKKIGITNFDSYACNPEYKDKLMPDLYVDDNPLESVQGIPSLTATVDTKKTGI